MVRSNTGDAGRAYLDLETGVVSESDSQITLRTHVYLTSRNVVDSSNRFFVYSNAHGAFVRDGAQGLNGVYNRTLLWYYDVTHGKDYGSARGGAHEANFSGVEFWGATLSVTEGYTIPARPYVAPGGIGSLSRSIQSSGAQITINWGTPSAGSAGLNGVEIQIGTSNGNWNIANGIVSWRTSYAFGASYGQVYYWRVRARNGHNQFGPWTGVQTATNVPAAPGTPTAGSITSSSVKLTYSAPANGGASISEYGVYVSTNSSFSSHVFQQWIGTGTSYTVGSLSPNTTYYARTRAQNSAGTGPYSGTRTFTTSALGPNAPTSVSATRTSDTSHTITWTNNPDSSRPITNSTLQRWDNVSNTWTTVASPGATTTSFTDTGTVANRQYRWQIRANNDTGSSAWVQSAVRETTPATPSSITATKIGTSSINLSWVPAASYNTAFEIFESQNGAAYSSTPLATVAAGTTTWSHPSPNPAVTHAYRVRAVSATPVLYSGYATSGTVQLQAPPNAPVLNAPSGTVDVAQNLVFSWSHNPVDSSQQTQYQWRWRLAGDTTWDTPSAVTTAAQTFTFTGANMASFGWVAGNTIEWEVRTRGADPSFGPWSNTSSFKLSSVPTTTIGQPVSTAAWEDPTAYVVWSYFQGESSAQAQYEIELYRGADTSVAPTETASGTGVTSAVALTTVLGDNSTWTVRVRTRSGDGLWSEWDTETFAVNYPEPLDPSVTLRWSRDTGWVEININNPTDPTGEAPETVSNDVYRKIDDGDWVKIVTDIPPNGSFTDHEGPVAGVARYRAVAWTSLPSTSTGPEQVLQFVDGTLTERDRPAPLYYAAGVNAENVMTNTRGSIAVGSEVLRTNLATNPSMETLSFGTRRNLVWDPRATNATRWSANFGTGGAGSETMVTGAVDGPMLLDGTASTTYARYTVTTPNTAGAPYAEYSSGTAHNTAVVYTATQTCAVSIYVRSSVAIPALSGGTGAYVNAVYRRADGTTVGTVGNLAAALPANTWVRVGTVFVTPFAESMIFSPRINLSGHILTAGQTLDIACAVAEPYTQMVGSYFDGDLGAIGTATNAWDGTAHASASTQTLSILPAALNLITNPRSNTTSGTAEVRRNRAMNPNLIGKSVTDPPAGGAVYTVTDEATGGPTVSGKWLKFEMTAAPTSSAGTTTNLVHVNGSGTGTDATAITPGKYVSVLGYRLGLSITTDLRFAVTAVFLNSSGTPIGGGTFSFTATGTPNGLWQRMQGTALAPAGSAYVRVYYSMVDSGGTVVAMPYTAWTASSILGFGPVTIETFASDPSALDQTFFDGYTESVGNLTAAWTGTENASESVFTGLAPTLTTSVADQHATYRHTEVGGTFAVRHHLLTSASVDLNWVTASSTLGVSGTGTYTLMARVRPSRAMTVWARIGGAVGTEVNLGLLPAGAWTEVRAITTAGSGAVGFRLKDADHSIGDFVDVDNRLVVAGAYAGPYFDGSEVNNSDFTAAWTGVIDASTSILFSQSVSGVTPSSGTVMAVSSIDNNTAGTRSLHVIAAGASAITDAVYVGNTSLTGFAYGMEAGKTYHISADLYLPRAHVSTSAASDSQQRRILFWWSNGTVWTPIFGPQGNNVAGLQRLKHAVTVPSGAVGVRLGLGCAGSALDPAFETYWDALLVEEVHASAQATTAADGIYFDGDSSSAPNGLTTAWTGVEHASTSQATGNIPAVTEADGVKSIAYQTTELGGLEPVRYYLRASGANMALNWWDATSGVTDLPEGQYTIGARVRPSRTMTVAFRLNDSSVSSPVLAPADVWTEVRATITTTALNGTTGLVLTADDHGAGDYVDLDYRMVITGVYSGAFFNGDNFDGPEGIFEWVGDPDESTSIKYISQAWPRHVVMSAYLSGGPDFSQVCRAHYDLVVSPTSGLVTRALHQFAGRLFPVEFSGTAQTYVVEMSFSTNKYMRVATRPEHEHDSVTAYPEWEALTLLRGPHLYRDFEGRRMYVSVSNVRATPRSGVARVYDVSLTVTRAEL